MKSNGYFSRLALRRFDYYFITTSVYATPMNWKLGQTFKYLLSKIKSSETDNVKSDSNNEQNH